MNQRYAKQCSTIGIVLVVAILLVGVIQAGSAAVNYTITRVSVSSSGQQGNAHSTNADVSGDGLVVAFESGASNLVQGVPPISNDIFVHDRQTGQTTRVSVSSSGEAGNNFSNNPTVSAEVDA